MTRIQFHINGLSIKIIGLIVIYLCISNVLVAEKVNPKDKEISVINGRLLSTDELIYIASLQGVVAKKKPLIYLDLGEYSFWIKEFEYNGYRFDPLTIEQLTERFLPLCEGYILADSDNISVAATVAGPLNAVVLTSSMAERKELFENLKMLMDVRGKSEEWLLEHIVRNKKYFSFESILQHNPARPYALIDYAIAGNKICIVGKNNVELVRKFYSLITPNTPRLGWGSPYGKEKEDVSLGAEYGLFTIPTSNTLNLTFFTTAKVANRFNKKHKADSEPTTKKAHYVMLMISDGDNLNWCLGGLVASDKYMSNLNAVGKKINWMYPPTMSLFIPFMHDFYQRYLPKNNYLIGAVSGAGYTYPSKHKNIEDYAVLTDKALKQSGLDYCVIMDLNDFRGTQVETLKKVIKKMPDVKGLYYMDYGNYAKWEGDYYTINNKPVVSFRYRLWLPNDPMEEIASKINMASRDITSPDAYSAVVVHAWSYNLTDVAHFIKMLDEDVVLVNADEFMKLISNNVKTINYE